MPDLERETALARLVDTVTAAIGAADELEPAARTTLEAVCQATGWPLGHLCVPADAGEEFVSSGIWAGAVDRFPVLCELSAGTRFRRGSDLVGRAAAGRPVWSADVTGDPLCVRARQGRELGVRAAFAFPVVAADGVAAVLEFFSPRVVPPDELLLGVTAGLGHQLGRVVDRRKAHQLLESSRNRLEQIIETSVEGFVSMDAAGRVTGWNGA
ncbi:GAF domain-containing protein, partial [Planomonospora alba]|uniref:GAF domain-containing protein n=1 Tax=Planomonospora alba TaxID=161354 RepID=UPI0031F1BD9A